MKDFFKPLIFLTACFLAGVSLPLTLFLANRKMTQEKNGFERKFVKAESKPVLSNALDLGFEGYYIAGHTNHSLFLGHKEAPAHILMVHTKLRDTTHLNLTLEIPIDNKRFNWERLKVSIDSPTVYMADGPAGFILKGNLFSNTVSSPKFVDSAFADFIPISENNIIFKTLVLSRGHTDLIVKSRYSMEDPRLTLEKQVDGIFCCDGMLLYDNSSHQILHVFFYRNQIISLDTLLRKNYSFRTIDTVSKAQIKLADIKAGRERTFGNIPTKVNRKSCIFSPNLYINSSLKADNESFEVFANNSVIDVYDIKKGTYLYSFYLPKYDDNELRYFQVVGQTVFALYQDHLITYYLQL